MPQQPALLLYNLEGTKGNAWRAAAMRLKIRIRTVSRQEYALPLAELLAKAAKEPAAGPVMTIPDEMLVMAHFPPGLMDVFLLTARRMGAAPVALKAVLTPTNARWNSLELYRELSAERDALSAGTKAHHEKQ